MYGRNHRQRDAVTAAFQRITDFVLGASLGDPRRVLVYCKQGLNRSASMAAGWLTYGRMRACGARSRDEAQGLLQEALSQQRLSL